jgi:hypothetical protein
MKYTNENNFYKVKFPILLGYVITGHKVQQATISNKIVIKVRNYFASGLTYVMLLWVTNQKHLLVCGNLTPNGFNPMV